MSSIEVDHCGCGFFKGFSNSRVSPPMDGSLDKNIHDAAPEPIQPQNTINTISNEPENIAVSEEKPEPEQEPNQEQENKDWEEDYFKKFDWLLEKEPLDETSEMEKIIDERLKLERLLHMIQIDYDNHDDYLQRSVSSDELDDYLGNIKRELSNVLEPFAKPPKSVMNTLSPTTTNTLDKADPGKSSLYLYMVSLEGNKILMHATVKKPFETVIEDCLALYEYARMNKPRRVVYMMPISGLQDLDSNVKLFMNMFGIDDCRGGSYTNPVLSDAEKEIIVREGNTATIDYFVEQERVVQQTSLRP